MNGYATRKMFDSFTRQRQCWIMLAERKREAWGWYFPLGGKTTILLCTAIALGYFLGRML